MKSTEQGLPDAGPRGISVFRQGYVEWSLAAVLFLATLISRIPFRSTTLFSNDSTGFALAIENFNMAQQHPHPPGYIVYIGAARLLNYFTGDPYETLICLSILSAAIAVVGIYFMGKSIFGRVEGIIAAVLLFFSPIFWFYSEVALSYELSVPIAMLIVWLLYQMYFNRRYAILCGLIMGCAAGVRQDLLIYLIPVFLVASLRVGWRRMLLSWGAVGLGVMVWLVPLILTVGDLRQFLDLQSAQYNNAIAPYSFFNVGVEILWTNGKEILKALLWLLGPAILTLVVTGIRVFKKDPKTIFLLVTTLPALAFFLFFFIDPPGYLLICAPALILLAAQAIAILAGRVAEVTRRIKLPFSGYPSIRQAQVAAIPVLLSSCICFVFFLHGSQKLDQLLPGTPGYEFLFVTYNANGISANNDSMDAAVKEVRKYDPDSTVVISNISDNVFNWSRLMYYLPEYRVVGLHLLDGIKDGAYKDGKDHQDRTRLGGNITLAPGTERIIFIGQDVKPAYLDFSNNAVVTQRTLISPAFYAPSIIAIVEPFNGFKLGCYTFSSTPS